MTKLNKKLLTAITAAIPKNDVRWFFNGLFIDYDRKYTAATDGHCLVLIERLSELENGRGARWISRPAVTEFIRTQLTSVKEFDIDSLLQFAAENYKSFGDGNATPEYCAERAANYPDVMRVIPGDAAKGKKGRPGAY